MMGMLAHTYALNDKGCCLTLVPLPPAKPQKIKSRKGSEKGLYMSETQVERAINKSKPLFTFLFIESNTRDVAKPMHPLA